MDQQQPKDSAERESFIDRAVRVVSPQAGVKRAIARLQLKEIAEAARYYEAARPSRFRKRRIDLRSPDLITNESAVVLRAQARYLDENYDIARGVLETLTSAVIGEGVETYPLLRKRDGTLHTDANEEIMALWQAWQKYPETAWEFDWYETQRMMCRYWYRDGEIFAQRCQGKVTGLVHGSDVQYSLELIEPDYIPFEYSNRDRQIIQGIQANAWGRPLNYFSYKQNPSEIGYFPGINVAGLVGLTIADSDLKTLPAERMIHLKKTDRIRQRRGITVFASVFTRLDDLKEFEESERLAARIGAAFAFAINRSSDYTGGTALSGAKLREINLAPGIIMDNLAPGESVESLKNERPNNNMPGFRKEMLRAVASGTGANYSTLSRDYDGSYSSQRQGMLDAALFARGPRRHFIARVVDPVWVDFVDMVRIQGLMDFKGVDPESYYYVEHRGAGIPYIDPKNEIEADIAAIRAGIFSRTGTILRRGGDPMKTRKQFVEERKQDKEDGLIFDTNAAQVPARQPGIPKFTGNEGGPDDQTLPPAAVPGAAAPAATDTTDTTDGETDDGNSTPANDKTDKKKPKADTAAE